MRWLLIILAVALIIGAVPVGVLANTTETINGATVLAIIMIVAGLGCGVLSHSDTLARDERVLDRGEQ